MSAISFFEDWSGIIRVIVVGALAYLTLLLLPSKDVALETDGSLTVVQGEASGDLSTLQHLHNYPPDETS